MKLRNFFYLSSIASILLLGSGCSLFRWFAGDVSDEEVKDLDASMSQAQAQLTRYDDSLRQFGKLLEAYDINPVKVQSKVITNDTADRTLPDDVSKMLATAINKIGTRVIYLPYDPNYIINEATTGGSINRALPQLVMTGGITEFDKDLIEKARELKAEGGVEKGQWGSSSQYDGSMGYNAEESVSRMSFDLSLLDYRTQSAIASSQVSNSINIRKTKLGWGIGAFFEGCGLTFDYTLKKQQGIYYGIRLLVEISTLETLGKYFDVPYWRCIPGATEDKALVARLREEFSYLGNNEKITYLREYLFFHGYNIDKTAPINQSDVDMINEAMKKTGTSNYTDLFLNLWETVPIDESRKRNLDYKNRPVPQLNAIPQPAKQQPQQAVQKAPAPQQQVQSAPPAPSQQQVQTRQAPPPPPIAQQTQQQPAKQQPKQPPVNSKEAPVGFGETEW